MAETKRAEKSVTAVREDTYTVDELIAASKNVFKVQQECAAAALKPLNKKEMTISEARAAIDKFMKKEVK